MNKCDSNRRPLFRSLWATCLPLLVPGLSSAAVITWGSARNIQAASDVSTNGWLVKAVCKAGGSYPVVNGVTFTPAYAGDSISGVNASNAAAGNLPVGGAISAAYASLLSQNDCNNNAGSTLTLTLNGLTVGCHYEVQIWANDSDASSLGQQTIRSLGALDPWVVLNMNTSGASGGKGQYALGTFTADAASQPVTITGSGSPVLQAYQLRRITNPLAAAAWGRWQETLAESDVNTNGTVSRAYAFGSLVPSAPLNGVTFTRFADQSVDTLAEMTNSSAVFGSAAAPYTNLSANYQTLLGQACWSATKYGSLTLNQLVPGQWYTVQVWVNDSRATSGGRRVRLNGSPFLNYNPGGPSDHLAYEGGLGHHAIGTFRAAAASQRIEFDASMSAQINALQLRAIPAPDPYLFEALQRNQYTLLGYLDGKITSTSRFDGVHLAFGSGDFPRGRSEMSSGTAWLQNNGYTFDLWPAMDATIRWKKYVDAVSRKIVKARLKTVNYRTPGTSNLLKMAETIRYLGSEEFGEDAFDHPDDDWRSSDPNARKFLIDKLHDEALDGISEFGSNDYGILNAEPSLSLGQLAQDPEMRAAGMTSFPAFMARMAVVWQPLEYYAGLWSSRSYEDQSGYYGTYGRLLYQALGGGARWGDGKSMALVAASGYTLPAPVLHAANERTNSYSVRYTGASAYQQAFVNANNYILFGSSDSRAAGSGWCWGCGVRWRGMKNFFWLNGCATDNPADMAAASNHGKMQLDFDMLLQRDSLLYAFDKSHPLARDPRYAQAQVPGGWLAMINDAATSGRIFVHYGTVMIAVASDALFTWDPSAGIYSPRNTPQAGDSEFRIAVGGVGYPQQDTNFAANISATSNRFAVAIETALPAEYAGADAATQLAAFKADLLATTSISHTDVTVSSYQITHARYVNRHGEVIEKESYNDDRSHRGGWINGVAVDYSGWPKVENPWMSTSPDGSVLTVTGGSQRTVLCYNQRPTLMTITTSNAPAARPTPAIQTLTPAGVTQTSATLVGEVLSTGASATSVTVYWGATDGGPTPSAWANSVALGTQSLGQVLAPISGLTSSTSYYVRHFATNIAGSIWSPATVLFTTAPVAPPTRPDGLATALAVGSIPLTWNAAAGATAYNVKRALTRGGPYSTFMSNVVATSYPDLLVTNGTVYYYVVSATGPGGESGNSGEAAGTSAVIPAAPMGLKVGLGFTNVQLSWNLSPWTSGYNVKRSRTSGTGYAPLGSTTSTVFEDNSTTNGGTYYYVVTATNIAGESPNSLLAAITVNFTHFLNWSPGNWSAVTWFPNPPGQPVSSTSAVLQFMNSAPIASTNDKGAFTLNQLQFLGSSVSLAGGALTLSGSGPLVSNAVDTAQTIACPLTLSADTTLGAAANSLTLKGVVSGAYGVSKTGDGLLALAATNSYSGNTILAGGTLQYSANNAGVKTLCFGSTDGSSGVSALVLSNAHVTATNLTVRNDDESLNTISLGAANTLAVNGGVSIWTTNGANGSKLQVSGGTFVISNSASDIVIGFNNLDLLTTRSNLLDLSGLAVFSATVSNFNIGYNSTVNYASPGSSAVWLAPTSTITANTLGVGNSGGVGGKSASTLLLGAVSNTLNADTIIVGDQKDLSADAPAGQVGFTDAGGFLFLRGKAGGSSAVGNLYVGSKTDTGSTDNHSGLVDLSGGIVTGRITNLYIGYQTTSGGSGNPKTYGTFRVGDDGNASSLNVTSVRVGYETSANSTTGKYANGTLEITGGTVTVGSLELTHDTNAYATLKVLGGTLTVGSDITTAGGNETLTLDGGALDLQGHAIGSAAQTIGTLNFVSGTLRNVAAINGTSGLVKSGSLTLTLEGANMWSGGTTVSGGTLAVDGSLSGNASVTALATLTGGGSLAGTATVNGVLAPSAVGADPDSVGTLRVGGLALAGGGQLLVTMTHAGAGAGVGWDLVNASNAIVTFTASPTTPFIVTPDTLGAPLPGWNPLASYQWKIISAALLNGFSTNNVLVDTNLFADKLALGSLAAARVGNDLYLTYAPFPPPAPPSSLTAQANSRLVTLTWNRSDHATGYNVKRATVASGPYTVVASDLPGHAFDDATVANGATYYYVVSALGATGQGADSAPVSAAPPGPMGAWRYRTAIRLGGFPFEETLTNFPLLVVLGTNVAGFAPGQFASASGGDLRFLDGAGNELSYEVEKWNPSGQSYVWVRIPQLRNSAALWAYWGNASNSVAPSYTTNGSTWESGYVGVWHWGQTPPAKGLDSTSNTNLATPNSYLNAASQQPGMIGGSLSFNGVNSAMNIPSTTALGLLGGQFTLSTWVNLNQATNGVIIGKGQNGSKWYSWFLSVGKNSGVDEVNTPNRLCVGVRTNSASVSVMASQTSDVVLSNWVHVAGTLDGSNLTLYVNGQPNAVTPTTWAPFSHTVQLWVGADSGRDYLNGRLDELRVEDVARSANWIWAMYHNVASNSLVNTYSAVTDTLGPPSLVAARNGNWLALSWPAAYRGWFLQQQTNTAHGFSDYWGDLPGSDALTSTNVPLPSSSPSSYFRLRYPY